MTGRMVSVVIPCFEGRDWILQAVKSALGQTYPNREVIVIEDGSRSDSYDLLKSLIEGGEIRYLVNDRNMGIPATRNRGISQARGEYIAFLDQDDLWHPEKLECQVREFQRPGEPGLVYTDTYFTDKKGRCLGLRSRKNTPVEGSGLEVLKSVFINAPITMSSVMVRKDCLDRLGPLNEDTLFCDDLELYLRVARTYRIGFVNRPLTYRCFHDKNSSLSDRFRGDQLRMFDKVVEMYPELAPLKKRKLHDFHIRYSLNSMFEKDFNQAEAELQSAAAIMKKTGLKVTALRILIKSRYPGYLLLAGAKFLYRANYRIGYALPRR